MLSLPRLNSPGLHVALHDVHAVLLVEGNAGNFVEAHHVVLADQPALAVGVVHEHPGDGRLAAGDQMGVGGNLLEEMALAGAARAKLDHVVVVLDERHHAQDADTSMFRSVIASGSRPTLRSRKSLPFGGAELAFARS